jgi:hypothetical protein
MLLYIIFNRAGLRLSILCFISYSLVCLLICLFFLLFLTADSYKVKTTETSPWETEKTKTDLITWQVSRPSPTQEQLRLWSGRWLWPPPRLHNTVLRQLNKSEKNIAESRLCDLFVQLMVSEVVSERDTSSHCQSWQLGPATEERRNPG